MSRRERREFTEEFKLQMVSLYNNGKPRCEIIREYDLTPSAFNSWVRKYNATGSFKACDNRTEEEKELIKLIKENQQLKNVKGKWNYICLIIDLYNREIIGYAAGKHKTADLVYKAFSKIKCDLSKINIFHTDRGNELKNKIIDEVLQTFKIERSLSKKGCPYNNVVAEATYKIITIEFAFNRIFESFEELELELFDYVNWHKKY